MWGQSPQAPGQRKEVPMPPAAMAGAVAPNTATQPFMPSAPQLRLLMKSHSFLRETVPNLRAQTTAGECHPPHQSTPAATPSSQLLLSAREGEAAGLVHLPVLPVLPHTAVQGDLPQVSLRAPGLPAGGRGDRWRGVQGTESSGGLQPALGVLGTDQPSCPARTSVIRWRVVVENCVKVRAAGPCWHGPCPPVLVALVAMSPSQHDPYPPICDLGVHGSFPA